jgi:O-antigen/teichoic acid export membrane protein
MRRVVALLPAEVVTVMFPRIVKTLAKGDFPNRILIQIAIIMLGAGGALSLLYFIFDTQLIRIVFGTSYQAAIPYLGWMGVAMIGVSLSSIWLNYYLAEKPRNFVILLGVAVALEWILLNVLPPSMQSAVLAFGTTGWLLTLGGLALYLLKIRPLESNGLSLRSQKRVSPQRHGDASGLQNKE